MTAEAKQFMPLSQAETNYTPVSITPGAACSSCRFFMSGYEGGSDGCRIVQSWPESIVPNGWCNEHRVYVEPAPEPLEVMIVDGGGTMEIEMESGERGITKLFKWLLSLAGGKDDNPLGFKVLPDNRWVGVFTNNFEDREGELFTEKAISEYVANVKAGTIPYPELWLWHLPGTKHGQADSLWQVGHFAIASGTFDDTPLAHKLRDSYQRKPLKAMSHGFLFAPKWRKQSPDGLVYYERFVTFEISPLSKKWAANSFTDFIDRMKAMEIPDDARKDIIERLGEKEGGAIITAALESGKQLEALMRSKALNDDPPTDPPPTDPTPPTEDGSKALVATLTEKNKALTDQVQMLLNANAGVPVLVKQVETLETDKKALQTENEALKATIKGYEELGVRPTRAPETIMKPDESVVGAWLAKEMKQLQEGQQNPTGIIGQYFNTPLGG